ncbi:unnamed protein product [Pedinophyceae sp. YPF-701]|nr:unnamed protein product [Pedinophyceae sp. YPF-701]
MGAQGAETLYVGCYERFLFGLTIGNIENGAPDSLERRFAFPAHQGSIKALDACAGFAVTGGSDDQIHLYETKGGRDRDLGFLVNPAEGAVTSVELFRPPGKVKPSHMLTGSQDGAIAVWQAGGDWQHMATLRGHKSDVNGTSIHRSARVAISVSRDRHLRLWDLVRGRCQYTSKLEAEADAVRFLPAGTRYALLAGPALTLQDVEGEVLGTAVHGTRVTAMQCNEAVVVMGGGDGTIKVWDVRAGAGSAGSVVEGAHKTRIRGIAFPGALSPSEPPRVVASGSSDGVVRLWDLRSTAEPLAEHMTGARITCVAAGTGGASLEEYAEGEKELVQEGAAADEPVEEEKSRNKRETKIRNAELEPKNKKKKRAGGAAEPAAVAQEREGRGGKAARGAEAGARGGKGGAQREREAVWGAERVQGDKGDLVGKMAKSKRRNMKKLAQKKKAKVMRGTDD